MLKKPAPEQAALEIVTLDSLVPKDHLLRKIDAEIDFSFIHDRVAGLYCADNGRPPLDPTCMFKALFIGYLFGVRSERQLVREIEVNVAYRWFLRLKLTDKIFDASTLSQNRRRRFNDVDVAQDIFDTIVEQALAHGLVDGTVLYTDSTHLKANANKGRYDVEKIAKSRSDYWADLDRAIEAERSLHGKKPLKEKDREPVVKETKVSRTDADSGYMVRDGKPKGFFYLDHRTVDSKPAFTFEEEADGYRCPEGQLLTYATTDRNGYSHYKSDPAICRDCPLLASCTSNAKAERTITRHVWQASRARVDAHRLTETGRKIYKRRKETVERSFADAKQLHGHRYARFRGIIKVRCQCLLAAAAQNIKKIAMALTRAPKTATA